MQTVDANIKESAKNVELNVLFELQDDINITFVQVFCLTRWDKDVLCFAVCLGNSSSGIENEFFERIFRVSSTKQFHFQSLSSLGEKQR